MLGAPALGAGGNPPAGPPTAPAASYDPYTLRYTFTWTAGDLGSYTRIYVGSAEPAHRLVTLNPGVQSWTSDIHFLSEQYDEFDVPPFGTLATFYFTHYSAATETSLVTLDVHDVDPADLPA